MLDLARDRKDNLRLVTTNFDRLFQEAAAERSITFNAYAAPMLPIPKSSRWNGLVYLHGLLPEIDDEAALNRLVLTSGDFGLAYLIERWASLFVSELFRNYSVCFIGYSLDDPVLRYMIDALSADRTLGEITNEAWAFGDYKPGDEKLKKSEWESKGVTPILYEVKPNIGHSLLHQTLNTWAEIYRQGPKGKDAIVDRHARESPQDNSEQNDFVGRMLWALSDPSGLPAKHFANLTPAPSLEWFFTAFSERKFNRHDLKRFGIVPEATESEDLNYSLISRPCFYEKAKWMELAWNGTCDSDWDAVMCNLVDWLMRHLNDPELILWFAKNGTKLHPRLANRISHELRSYDQLESSKELEKLDDISRHSPKAIPSPKMRTLWRLLLNGHIISLNRSENFHDWPDRLMQQGLTASLRLEFRKLFEPKLSININRIALDGSEFIFKEEPITEQDLTISIVFIDRHAPLYFHRILNSIRTTTLPLLLEEIQQLLKDALDLWGEVNDEDLPSRWALPSIEDHKQNGNVDPWAYLIVMLREAWLEVYKTELPRAKRIAQSWFELPYSTFKRLALFAASKERCLAPNTWVRWLTTDGNKWLWDTQTKREVCRLLVLQGKNLSGKSLQKLEAGILQEPPDSIFKKDLPQDELRTAATYEVWLLLEKLRSSGCYLTDKMLNRLDEISHSYPKWKLSANERDEFIPWSIDPDDPDDPEYKELFPVTVAPRKIKDLVEWLKQPLPKGNHYYEDNWYEVCVERPFKALIALCILSQDQIWPEDRWKKALIAWSSNQNASRSWRYAAQLVLSMPDKTMKSVVSPAASWLHEATKSSRLHPNEHLALCLKLLKLTKNLNKADGTTDQAATLISALNHPVGNITQSLLQFWMNQEPKDHELLPNELKPIFTKICDVKIKGWRHGRVILASRLVAFFRVDPSWTKEHLIPLLDWRTPIEAQGAWEGFLWSPRLHHPLQAAIKAPFLESVNHYDSLGQHRKSYAALLTYAALDPTPPFMPEVYQKAFDSLSQEGLEDCMLVLYQAIESRTTSGEEYWKNRISPFWHAIWPKKVGIKSSPIAEGVVRILLATGKAFPDAYDSLKEWLMPIEYLSHIVGKLSKTTHCTNYPDKSLDLLDRIVDNQQWAPKALQDCLGMIQEANPKLSDDHRFKRLEGYLRGKSDHLI